MGEESCSRGKVAEIWARMGQEEEDVQQLNAGCSLELGTRDFQLQQVTKVH